MKIVFGNIYFALSALKEAPIEIRKTVNKAQNMLKISIKYNLIKLDKEKENVTFSFYPHLSTHAHPYLKESVKVNIETGDNKYRKESTSNPVILHRIETMLESNNDRIPKLKLITKKEESLNMFGKEHKSYIGRRSYWNKLCDSNNILESKSPAVDENHKIDRWKTAIHRKSPSKPTTIAYENNYIKGNVFDWGCGNGRDTKYLKELGLTVWSYDKYLKPKPTPSEIDFSLIDTIICNYVINVIEDKNERSKLIKNLFLSSKKGTTILISARSKKEISLCASKSNWKIFGDGFITKKNTFQKGFSLEELMSIVLKHGNVIEKKATSSYVFIIAKK